MTDAPDWENILYILALTVIIDQQIRDPELTEFLRQAAGLAEFLERPASDVETLRDWYEAKEEDILEAIRSKGKNTVILRALAKVKDPVVRENLYDSMIAISLSDKEFHKVESDLIRSAAAIWGFMPPPIRAGQSFHTEPA